MAQPDNTNTTSVAVIGFLGTVAVFLIVMLLQVIYFWAAEGQREVKVLAHKPVAYRSLVATQREKLGAYAWEDKSKGVVRVPIERAMELVVKERSKGQKRDD